MSDAAISGFAAGISDAIQNWGMSFQSVHFLLFLPVVVGATFCLPKSWRRGWLLLASYYFYFFAAPRYLWVLLAGTIFAYLVGRALGAAQGRGAKNLALGLGLAGLLATLLFFKYNRFFEGWLSPLFARMGIDYAGGYFITAGALGISFYTFTAVGYLIDVWRGDAPAQKNLLTFALFLGFFPAVTSGPISRAGGLMPQLEDLGAPFNRAAAPNALRRIALGYFKKLAVADTLAVFVNAVFADLPAYTGLTLIAANIAWMLQLYFDFSGYTDIALGVAELLGIRLPENFNTPYFATNFSGFWARWHISLSGFLQDYIFTPLVWSRWTEKLPILGRRVQKPPVLSSLAVVFLVSGLWHGDTLCYLAWGALQAAFRIGEELLHRRLGKPQKKPPFRVVAGKRLVVWVLWMQSLIFFRVGISASGKVADAASALLRQFAGWSPAQLGRDIYDAIFYGVYNHSTIVALFCAYCAFCLLLALGADWWQFSKLSGGSQAAGLGALPRGRRWAAYYVLVLACFAGFILQSGGFGGSNFIYGGF